MSESHLNEVEKTLLYISEARERAERAGATLVADGAEPHLVAALNAAEKALAENHRKLIQRTFFVAAPSSDQERVAR